MGDNSKIEWTDATWNPVTGCAKVSEGCRNCYAMRVAHRLAGMGQERYQGLTEKRPSGVEWNGKVKLVGEVIKMPIRMTRPRKFFVNSMSDLFHPDIPFEFIDQVFAVMMVTPRHSFQILTKRPERMLEYTNSIGVSNRVANQAHQLSRSVKSGITSFEPRWPLLNVWLGVSVENQKAADERIPLLLQTSATVRWLSIEPLLGSVDISKYMLASHVDNLTGGIEGVPIGAIDWVVVGGESGSKARPMHPDWARSLRDQCIAAGMPFFFKQWGEWAPGECVDKALTRTETAAYWGMYEPFFRDRWDYQRITRREYEEMHFDDQPDLWKVGKKKAGRLLDGRTWDDMPTKK